MRIRSIRPLSTALLLAALWAASSAGAQPSARFDLPAQSLADALRAVGERANVNIFFAPALVAGRQAAALQVTASAEEALQQLLSGTGLTFQRVDEKTITIVSVAGSASATDDHARGAMRLAQADSQGSGTSESTGDGLEEIIVKGTAPARYRSDESQNVLGVPISVFKTPRSVVVLPEQILLDQKITQLDEALKNVSGISRSDGFGGTNDDFMLRGFRRDNIYRDGRRVAFSQRNSTTDIERIEVLKGPSSLLFGAIEPGGVVNIVTKRPQATPRRYTELTLDEFGKRHVMADFSGAANQSKSLLFRISASYENSDTFRDHNEVRRTVVSPSLTWKPTEADEVRFSYNFFDERLPVDRGAIVGSFADGRHIVETPRSRTFGEPWERSDATGHTADLRYQHAFNGEWSFDVGYNYQDTNASDIQVRAYDYYAVDTPFGGTVLPAGTLIRQVGGDDPFDVTSGQYSARVTGNLHPAGMQYSVVAGADGGFTDTHSAFYDGRLEYQNLSLGLPLFNVFHPVYGNLEPTPFDLTSSRKAESDFRGMFLQNVLQPNERLVLTAGIRRDWFSVASTDQDYDAGGLPDGPGEFADREWSGNSYQLGVLYEVVDGLALYGSKATSFTIHPYFNDDPRSKPQAGDQLEFGIKGDLLQQRLQFALSWFDLTKTNIPVFNPNSTGPDDRYRFIGEARSKGYEMDVTVRLAEGLNVIASYADFNYEITKDADVLLLGKTGGNVAPRTANLWGSYELRHGPLQGLGFGAGINYVAQRYGDDENTWTIPSYTLMDAGVWYYAALGRASAAGPASSVRFQLSLKNITDERWYVASDGDRFAPSANVGYPRTALFSVAYQF